ncbi:MAG: peptidoglycan-binding protein [Pseudomonadota bacterium]|nr:peptidoglycan-binding protein [Pseudomonadota bacterium]
MTRTRKTGYTQLYRQKATTLATTLLLSYASVGHAQPGQTEQVIFSAENALYGAGYDIGRADGWFDNDLHNAVRAYQKASGLAVNGNLDNPTLSALGVAAATVQSISDNALGNRAQSVEALGLASPARQPVAGPDARKTVVEKTVAPQQPAVDEEIVEKAVAGKEPVANEEKTAQVPAPTPEPARAEAVSEKVDDTGRSVQTAENEQIKPEEKQITTAEISTASEGPSPAPVAENTVDATPAAVAASETTTAEPSEAPQAVSETGSAEQPMPEPAEPEEQVAVSEPSETQANDEPRRSGSGGGFFSALFDFFFGWLV